MRRLAAPEGRVARLIIAVSIAAFLIAVAIGGPYFRSFDEAKYLGIGYSVLAGQGPRTVFGAVFLPHSPLWPVVLAAPDLWFGLDPFAWGQVLNALAGGALLVIVGGLGWQIRPLVGAFAVGGYVALPYLADLTRTARLDVPAAVLALAYVLVGVHAVRRGSVRGGVLAGAIFAAAFCVKEIVLPLAPVPFLAGLLIGRPLRDLARVASSTAAVAAIGTSWWFWLVASYTHLVYRLGVSATYLPAIYLGLVILVVLGLALPGRVATREPDPHPTWTRAGTEPLAGRRRMAAWGIALAWFAALAVFFDRNGELQGVGLISLGQLRLYAETWLLPSPVIAAVAVAGVAGVLIAIVDRIRSGATTMWFDVILLTLLCSAPLVLLVIAVGEPPRNYLAQIGLLAVLSGAGWMRVAEAVLNRLRPVRDGLVTEAGDISPETIAVPTTPGEGLARSLDRSRDARLLHPALAALGIAVLAGSAGLAGLHALATRSVASSTTRASAVDAATAWIQANVPRGTRIGFGSFLGYETAVNLAGQYPMTQIHQALAVVDPSAALGLAAGGQRGISDWVAMDVSRREHEFYVFRASTFQNAVRRDRIAYYVYLTGPNTSVPPLLGVLTAVHGFAPVAEQEFASRTAAGVATTTGVHIYRVEPTRVDLAGSAFYATPEALDRLVRLLAADRQTTPATAEALIAHATTWPDPAAAGPILDRLRGAAGG
ncbi:MAG TPA: hypothetical protein VGO64_08030 [Candidatus Limnocylindrales bacterium]|nr:hypothetical protein [Candidatus Limnocylindrales bacterium]